MSSIVLLHTDGPDRQALTAYLNKAGYQVLELKSFDELVTAAEGGSRAGARYLVEEAALPEGVDTSFLLPHPLVIIGRRRRLALPAHAVRLDEPYFLNGVVKALEDAGVADPTPATPVASPLPERAPDLPMTLARSSSDPGLVLRGVAHALNNPLSGASGWLQLLAVDLGEGDPRLRALHQIQAELQRMERLIQALALIGGRPGHLRASLDLATVVKDRVRDLQREGLPVTFESGPSLPLVQGDPNEFGLMLDLILGSFLEDRGRVKKLDVRMRRDGPSVSLSISEDGGTLVGGCDAADLGLLLRRMRHSRAIGIALAAQIIRSRSLGHVSLDTDDGGRVTLLLRVPAAPGRETVA